VSVDRPHSKYQHVFGVLRIDEPDDLPDLDLADDLSLIAVFGLSTAAEAEPAWLNALAREAGRPASERARTAVLRSREGEPPVEMLLCAMPRSLVAAWVSD